MDDRTIARRFFISGIVQGVGFRYFAQRAAARLGITGYARNLSDGRVEVYATGSPDALKAFSKELKQGPRGASVSRVSEEDAGVQDAYARRFVIEYDA
ncbi:MAG TPA: acylphosphatase [Candidatus Dormibacteraeota bacterium]|nr:acylphosphatase [Candidatus Dormibacteraeota bacterium]